MPRDAIDDLLEGEEAGPEVELPPGVDAIDSLLGEGEPTEFYGQPGGFEPETSGPGVFGALQQSFDWLNRQTALPRTVQGPPAAVPAIPPERVNVYPGPTTPEDVRLRNLPPLAAGAEGAINEAVGVARELERPGTAAVAGAAGVGLAAGGVTAALTASVLAGLGIHQAGTVDIPELAEAWEMGDAERVGRALVRTGIDAAMMLELAPAMRAAWGSRRAPQLGARPAEPAPGRPGGARGAPPAQPGAPEAGAPTRPAQTLEDILGPPPPGAAAGRPGGGRPEIEAIVEDVIGGDPRITGRPRVAPEAEGVPPGAGALSPEERTAAASLLDQILAEGRLAPAEGGAPRAPVAEGPGIPLEEAGLAPPTRPSSALAGAMAGAGIRPAPVEAPAAAGAGDAIDELMEAEIGMAPPEEAAPAEDEGLPFVAGPPVEPEGPISRTLPEEEEEDQIGYMEEEEPEEEPGTTEAEIAAVEREPPREVGVEVHPEGGFVDRRMENLGAPEGQRDRRSHATTVQGMESIRRHWERTRDRIEKEMGPEAAQSDPEYVHSLGAIEHADRTIGLIREAGDRGPGATIEVGGKRGRVTSIDDQGKKPRLIVSWEDGSFENRPAIDSKSVKVVSPPPQFRKSAEALAAEIAEEEQRDKEISERKVDARAVQRAEEQLQASVKASKGKKPKYGRQPDGSYAIARREKSGKPLTVKPIGKEIGGLIIHRPIDEDGNVKKKGGYNLTHVGTGMAVVTNKDRVGDLEALRGALIATGVDFTSKTSEQDFTKDEMKVLADIVKEFNTTGKVKPKMRPRTVAEAEAHEAEAEAAAEEEEEPDRFHTQGAQKSPPPTAETIEGKPKKKPLGPLTVTSLVTGEKTVIPETPAKKPDERPMDLAGMGKLPLYLDKFPSGRYGFSGGGIPGNLAYVTEAGEEPTAEQLKNARVSGPSFAGLKTRSWATVDEALAAAKAAGAADRVNFSASVGKPAEAEPEPEEEGAPLYSRDYVSPREREVLAEGVESAHGEPAEAAPAAGPVGGPSPGPLGEDQPEGDEGAEGERGAGGGAAGVGGGRPRADRPKPVGARGGEGSRVPGPARHPDTESAVGGVGAGVRGGAAGGGPQAVPASEPAPESDGARVEGQAPDASHSGRNFRAARPEDVNPGGQIARIRANIRAIETVQQIGNEGRSVATQDEQAILAKWTGWGSSPQLFDSYQAAYDERKTWRELAERVQQLLTEEEWEAARKSTVNAHYTSPEVVMEMWAALQRMGFKGGKILEPAMGSGNFLAFMPPEIAGKSRTVGVELDRMTARIAALLYPETAVQQMGFQEYKVPDGMFDLAISNVPFSEVGVFDKEIPASRSLSLHDYFFVRALKKVRPGGIVAFITSRYTMDKMDDSVRQRLADEGADFLGAVRLPDTAFKKSAGTEVVTDVIFIQKRAEGEPASETEWTGTSEFKPEDYYGDRIHINDYFLANPQQVVGKFTTGGTMYRGGGLTVEAPEDYEIALSRAFAALPEKIYKPATTSDRARNVRAVNQTRDQKAGALTVQDGKLYRSTGSELLEVEGATKDDIARVEGLLGLRSAVRALFAAQLDGEDTKAPRDLLNKLYDNFKRRYGSVRSKPNRKWTSLDADGGVIEALENADGVKSPVFKKDTVRPRVKRDKAASIPEAIAISLFEHGSVDVAAIAKLLGKTQEGTEAALADSGLAFNDPAEGWVTKETYLSGNVRKKLLEARAAALADTQFARNVPALEAVQPKDIPHTSISVRLGAPWVAESDIASFAAKLAETFPRNVKIGFVNTPQLSKWTVSGYGGSDAQVRNIYGTSRRDFWNLLEDALNGRHPRIYDYHSDGSKTLNADETAAAAVKMEEIGLAFEEWIWADDARRQRLHRYYNDNFNNTVAPKFSADHYKDSTGEYQFPGMNPEIRLRKHQADAVWRTVATGRLLYDHEVGTGKTYTMVASAMELKRTGLSRKPMMAVPTNVLAQVALDARKLYPGARILAMPQDADADTRRRTFSEAATGDWDLVIVSHENLNMLEMRPETAAQFYSSQIAELHAVLDATTDKKTVKQLQKSLDRLQEKLTEAVAGGKKEGTVFFEEVGADFIIVDEAHAYKSLPIYSSRERIKGVPTSESDRAINMLMRTMWLQDLNGRGRGVALATGTPVTNTMAELYNVQRYLQRPELEASGIMSFDAWVTTYAKEVTALEPKATGEYKTDTRLAKFVNLADLKQLAAAVIDHVRADQVGEIVRPTKKGETVIAPMTEAQENYLTVIKARAEIVRRQGKPKKGDDNWLSISTDARKSALDARMVIPGAPDDPASKVNELVRRVLAVHKANPGKTQMVFSDLGVNPTDWGFSVYKDIIEKLVKGGIPRDKIIDYTKISDAKRVMANERMRSGDALVAIGSSQKMGVGVNAQNKLIALHHLDAPWVPAMVEQREGRGWRDGNENKELQILTYTSGKSFDVLMWQTLARKATFIEEFFKNTGDAREVAEADPEGSFTYAQIAAATSDNPLFIEKIQLDEDVINLERQRRRWKADQGTYREKADWAARNAKWHTETAGKLEEEFKHFKAHQKEPLVIGGKTYEDKAEADAAIKEATKGLMVGRINKLGTYAGFELVGVPRQTFGNVVSAEMDLKLVFPGDEASQGHNFNEQADSPTASMDGVLRGLTVRAATERERAKDELSEEKKLRENAGGTWPKEQVLAEKRARKKELEELLEKKDKKPKDGEEPEDEPPEESSPSGEAGYIKLDMLVPLQALADAGRAVSRMVGTREERYEALLGEAAGKRAFELELYKGIQHGAAESEIATLVAKQLSNEDYWRWLAKIPYVGERGAAKILRVARSLPKIGHKFGVARSEMEALFDAAEGILGVDTTGKPVFGTKIYERDKAGYILDPLTGLPKWKWRFEPKVARANFDKLSPKGKEAVLWWVQEREYMKAAFKVVGGIEGYVHHYWADGFFAGMKRIRFKYRRAAERQMRMEAQGYSRDFELAVEKGMQDLFDEAIYNDFLKRFSRAVTLPVGDKSPLLPGWKEIPKTAYTRGGHFVGQVAGGRQIPEELYDEFVRLVEGAADPSVMREVANNLMRYWKGNVLNAPGTTVTNAISGGLQYATKVIDDLWRGMLTGKFRPFIMDLIAPIDALRPSTIEAVGTHLFGAEANISTQFGPGNDVLSKIVALELWMFGAIENFWKRTIYASEARARGKDPADIKIGEHKSAKGRKEQSELLELNRIIDRYAFNYFNEPPALRRWKQNPAGSAIMPFPTYGYKLLRLFTHYASALNPFVEWGDPKSPSGAARNLPPVGGQPPSKPPPGMGPGGPFSGGYGDRLDPWVVDRLARILTLGTIFYLIYGFWPRKDEETGHFIYGMPWALDKTGRRRVGVTELGKERYLRTVKYPWLNIVAAVETGVDLLRGKSNISDITGLADEFWSGGPLLGAAMVMSGFTDKYSKFKPPGVQWGEIAKTWIPFFRWAEGLRAAGGGVPGIREGKAVPLTAPKDFWETIAKGVPLPDKLLDKFGLTQAMHIRTQKVIAWDQEKGKNVTRQVPVILDPTIEALKFWAGVNIKEVDPEQYALWKQKLLGNAIKAIGKATTYYELRSALDRVGAVDPELQKSLKSKLREKEIRLTEAQKKRIDNLIEAAARAEEDEE